MITPALIVAGPTASGKSALALSLAKAFGGTVINADSMQVYERPRILSACPSARDEGEAPHRLYGVLPVTETGSVARWLEMARAEIAACSLPIVAGGTGLYLKALTEGLSPVPEIPDPIRAEARALFQRLGNTAFHARLADRDPVMAARLDPGNSQRLTRAWEVVEATGRSLADWQAVPPEGAVAARWLILTLMPPRAEQIAACDGRFLTMLDHGALDEARDIRAMGLDPALPVMKTLGLPELLAHLEGKITLAEATVRAQTATRQYAKRQTTWFRHQLPGATVIEAAYCEAVAPAVIAAVRRFLAGDDPGRAIFTKPPQ